MKRYVATFLTSVLLIAQLSILYFWIVDWKKTVTQIGLLVWGGSILVGILLYLTYRRSNEKALIMNRNIVLVGTFGTILLALLSLLIEGIVSSMP